jgi:hypothetical protein
LRGRWDPYEVCVYKPPGNLKEHWSKMKNYATEKSISSKKEAVSILRRRIISSKSAQSRYLIGNSIITVNSCFDGTKTMGDALFDIAMYRMERKQTAQTGLRVS